VTRRAARLAKLTRPRLHEVLDRRRLFERLDQERARPLVWVVGPPGAGKTALVASYLDARSPRSIWLHLDPGDEDLATFFHYLSQSLEASARRNPLPVITPEYRANLEGFTRYYFREFFARLASPAVLVFDNYQDIPADSALHRVLAQATREAPSGVTLLVISREDPPVEFARIDASDQIARIEWRDLRLTLDEATAIAGLRHHLSEETVRALYGSSGGWAAGFTLVLEHLRRSDEPASAVHGGALEPVFNYFAGQILADAEPEVQAFLMETALLPRTTAELASALTGATRAGRWLEHFYRRRLFTDRRGEPPYSYQYHDLFRTFLLDCLEHSRTPAELDALRHRAGALLESADRYDEAASLYRRGRDWASLATMALARAQILIAQGRGATLREWIGALPEPTREAEPWLGYWHGLSLIAAAPDQAVKLLTRAYSQLSERQDSVGQTACSCAIIMAYLSDLSDYSPLEAWVDRLIEAMRSTESLAAPTLQLYANASLTYYFHVCRPRAPEFERVLQCALRLQQTDTVPLNDKIVPTFLLLHALREAGRLADCDRVIAAVATDIDTDAVSPGDRSLWYEVLAWTETSRGRSARILHAARRSEAICRAHAIESPARHVFTHMIMAASAIQSGDLQDALDHVNRLDRYLAPERVLEQGWVNWLRCIVAGMRNDWEGAVRHADAEIALLSRGSAVFHLFYAHLHHACGLTGLGRFDEAAAAVSRARAIVTDAFGFRNLADVELLDAWVAMTREDWSAFDEHVREAMDLARRTEPHAYLWYVDQRILPGVLAQALERGVESETVATTIRALDLSPPANAGPAWPWPVRVQLLGTFEIRLQGVPLAPVRKSPRKILSLLKALCCGGEWVSEAQLLDWLWPDSEADAGRKSLDIALHRLRSMLGTPHSVKVRDGKIGLDRRVVWADAWAFESRANGGDRPFRQCNEVIALYRGPLLPGDSESVWTVSYRERLRGVFNGLLTGSGADCERAGDWESALRWYQGGLDVDDLHENTYLGAMRCQWQLGRSADARATYDRLRRTFALKLRALPSRESLDFARMLGVA
jgi:LuxR family transcriptional regulator, maltose regulon positive regulatory protein